MRVVPSKEQILASLSGLPLADIPHSQHSLQDHCGGVFDLLQSWQEPNEICVAGLCHSLYGTEIFQIACVDPNQRGHLQSRIGADAERLVYLFCSMQRHSLWENLGRNESFRIENRWTQQVEPLTEAELRGLFALVLANQLEMRPRLPISERAWGKTGFLLAQRFLSPPAFLRFCEDYGILKNGAKKVLVIGATLYIGRLLVERLLSEGYNVSILSRGLRPDPFGLEVQRLVCDRQDPTSFGAAIGNQTWDFVYDHLCFTADDAATACALFSGRTSQYVMLSSHAVYDQPGAMSEEQFDPLQYRWQDGIQNETLRSDKPNLYTGSRMPNQITYSESKRRAEAVIANGMESPYTLVRMPMVLDHNDPTLRLHREISRGLQDLSSAFSSPFETAAIYAPEAADFLLWLTEQQGLGAINIASTGGLRGAFFEKRIRNLTEQWQAQLEKIVPHDPGRKVSAFWYQDSYLLNCSRAEALGFKFRPIESWLGPLIDRVASEILTAASKERQQESRTLDA